VKGGQFETGHRLRLGVLIRTVAEAQLRASGSVLQRECRRSFGRRLTCLAGLALVGAISVVAASGAVAASATAKPSGDVDVFSATPS
jgi:hypothetical protein